MYTPLNGSVLNGSSYGVWADNTVATSSAECSASIRRIVSAGGAVTAVASAESVGVRERLCFSTITAQADQTAVAVRLVYLDSGSSGEAIGTASAPILRWSDAVAEVSAALTPLLPWRAAYTDSSISSVAESSLDDNEITIYAVVSVKRSPARANAFVHEWSVTELRTRIITNTGFALARARTSSIANAPLGFGLLDIAAESSADQLFVTKRFKGTAEGTSEFTLDIGRVRVGDGTQPGTAESYSSPNITSGGVTYAYAGAEVAGESSQVCNALRVRQHIADVADNTASIDLTPYYVLDHPGKSIAVAEAAGMMGQVYKALWYESKQGKITADASTSSDGIRFTWVYAEGVSDSMVDSTADADRLRWVGAAGATTSVGEASAVFGVYRDASCTSYSIASSDSTPTKYPYVTASNGANATVDVSAIIYGSVYVAVNVEATAEITIPGIVHYKAQHVDSTVYGDAISESDGLRIFILEPLAETITAESTSTYYLNIGKPAASSRTYKIGFEDRVYNVESTNREYTI